MSKFQIDQDVLDAYKGLEHAVRNATMGLSGPLRDALERLNRAKDPYRKLKDNLVELFDDGFTEHGWNLSASERERVRQIVDDIFNGSDWTQELCIAMLKQEVDSGAGDAIFGLFGKRSLIEYLEGKFFAPRVKPRSVDPEAHDA